MLFRDVSIFVVKPEDAFPFQVMKACFMTSTSHRHFCFIGQPSFHHQARPLTHPPLQWCCAAADPASFIMCLSVPVSVCPIDLSIHTSIHPWLFLNIILFSQTSNEMGDDGSWLCMPCKTGIWKSLFLMPIPLSITYSSTHPSVHRIHSCIHQSIHDHLSINPLLPKSIHPCFWKDLIPEEDFSFLFLKSQSLVQSVVDLIYFTKI